ncbi:MAG: 1-acylglycerol-3-phosphate O-acyltransferase [Idiomarina sp.]
MLAVLRLIGLAVFFIVVGIGGSLFCILRPFHADNTRVVSHLFGRMHRLLGLRIEIRVAPEAQQGGPYVYIANHQHTYDIFTLSSAVPKNTVTIGKKSLKWIPFFGQLYWLSGNILIDRKNSGKAKGTIAQAASAIKRGKQSILLFPEGTRSYGRGLLPFKTGAFRTAIQANVNIVPICVSQLHNKIKLNRWNNGLLIIEIMPPVSILGYSKEHARELMNECHARMATKIAELDAEIEQRERTALEAENK